MKALLGDAGPVSTLKPLTLDPQVKAFGDSVVALFPGSSIAMEFSRFSDHRDTLSAELHVTNPEHLHWARINLASAGGRREVVRALEEELPMDWRGMLDRACRRVALHVRTTPRAVELVPRARAGAAYLIEPLIPRAGRATVIHADGGSWKSGLGVALALARFHAVALPGLSAPTSCGSCLYLDWETDQPTVEDREHRIALGLGVSGQGAIFYRWMDRPLVEAASAIRRDVAEHKIGFVIVDSLQYAVLGTDRGDVAAPYTSLFNTLRTLGPDVTALVLAHHSHAGDDKREAHPYGSRFIHNACGSRWELRVDREDATDLRPAGMLLALYNRKMNDDALKPPLALRVVFDGDTIRLEPGDVKTSPELLKRAPLRARIAATLSTGALDVKTVVERVNEQGTEPVSEDHVRRTLDRYTGKDWVKIPHAKPVLYGLPSYAHA